MPPSKLSDDDLYARYLEPTAYDSSCHPSYSSLDPHSPCPSSYDSTHYYPPLPQKIALEAPYTFTPTGLDAFKSETGGLYLSEQIGVETELHTIFGSSHREQRTGSDVYGSYPLSDSQELDNELDSDLYAFLKAESSGNAWHDWEPHSKSASRPDDFPTTLVMTEDSRVAGGKRLTCDSCHKPFTFQHDLLRHTRTLHRQNGRVYRCAVPGCTKGDKIYNRLDNFKQHLKTTHRDDNLKEMVQKSKTWSGNRFTITTPAMYSSH